MAATMTGREEVEVVATAPVIPSGIYTVVGPTGRRSFTIERQSESDDFAPGKRVVSLLVGQNNEQDWKSFGFVSDEPARHPVSVFRKFRGTANEPSEFEKYAGLLAAMLVRGTREFTGPDGSRHTYRILLSKRCFRCDRLLTTEKSITDGIGPECAKKDPVEQQSAKVWKCVDSVRIFDAFAWAALNRPGSDFVGDLEDKFREQGWLTIRQVEALEGMQ